MMKYRYFVGAPHHKIHLQYYKSLLGGEFISYPCDSFEKQFPDELFEHDGEDVVWFFSNWYPALHPLLKGKQIFVEHGLSFKPSLNKERVECTNSYFDMIFSSGISQRDRMLKEGVLPGKIQEIGYTTLFQIPELEVAANQILLSVSHFGTWNEYGNLLEIIKRMPASINAYVTMHPSLPEKQKKECLKSIEQKNNVKYIKTQKELLAVTASSRCILGGSSSVCTPFWYLGKPVIFVRGKQTRVPFYGWQMVRNKMDDPLFNKILAESTKISSWKQFSSELIENAKVPPSRKEIFYSTNWDKDATNQNIQLALEKL